MVKSRIVLGVAASLLLAIIYAHSGGHAAVASGDRTGRTGSNCGSCHSGGNFGTAAQIEVLGTGGTAITSYMPGTTYTLKVTYTNSIGSPAGFGSQTVAVLSNNSTNAGSLSSVTTSNTQISSLSGRSYLEQQGLNSTGVFEASWTAPVSGSGVVTFYSSGHAANGSGTSGDDATAATLTLSEAIVCNPILANETVTDANPNGASNGAITTAPSGGTSPYTYNWNTGSNAQNVSGLSAGNYTLTITDANACADTFIFVVNQPSPCPTIVANETIINASTHGGTDGSIALNPSGGIMPYSYQWSNSTTTQTNSSLGAATYTVTISDVNSCTAVYSFVITEPASPCGAIAGNASLVEPSCFGFQNGEIVLSPSGGTAPYSFDWNIGSVDSSIFILGAGTYSVTITDSNACTDTLTFTLNEPTLKTSQTAISICQGESYSSPAGNAYSTTGIYFDTVFTTTLCDSIIETDLTVNPVFRDTQLVTICEGASFQSPGGIVVNTDTVFVDSLSSIFGCDSTTYFTINIEKNTADTNLYLICPGDSASTFLHGQQTTPIQLVDTFTSVLGCDSVVVTKVEEYPNYSDTIAIFHCGSFYILPFGDTAFSNGFFPDTLISINGCDSVEVLNIIFAPILFTNNTVNLCPGEIFIRPLGDTVFTNSTYVDTLTSANSCDSVVTSVVSFRQSFSDTVASTLCFGDSIQRPNGTFVSNSGQYTDTLQSIYGCDSVVQLQLTVLPFSGSNFSVNLCFGQLASLPSGKSVSTSGIFQDTLTNQSGCDSIITATINIAPLDSSSQQFDICEGDSIQLPSGHFVLNTGFYADTLMNGAGCDSVIFTSLHVSPVKVDSTSFTICQGDSLLLPDGNYAFASTFFIDSNFTGAGCDSIDVIILEVLPKDTTNFSGFICEGDSGFIFGKNRVQAGFYFDTLTNSAGCDSILAFQLTVNDTFFQSSSQQICAGDSILMPDGSFVSTAGPHQSVFSTSLGCDSIYEIVVDVLDTAYTVIHDTFCINSTYQLPDGSFVNQAGSYSFHFTTLQGCDSTVDVWLEMDTVDVRVEIFPTPAVISDWFAVADTTISSFRWLDCDDNFSFTGVTSFALGIPYTSTFAVEVTQNGCIDTSICVNAFLSTQENQLNNAVRVYPNPSSGLFTISIEDSPTPISLISVFDISGKQVYQNNTINCTTCLTELDLIAFDKGVYFLEVQNSTGSRARKKIVLQN